MIRYHMGIELNYRTSAQKKEIIDALIEIKIEATPVLIWQNDNGIRKVTKAKIDQIYFHNDSIVLTPYSDEDKQIFMNLTSDKTIYLRGNSKSIVFKQEQKSIKTDGNKSIQIFIPNIVKMFEKRTNSRLDFSNDFLKLSTLIYPGSQVDRKTKSINAELRDVSASGMGFYLDKKYGRLLFEKDKIRIESIGNHHFPRAIYGQIIYISQSGHYDNRIRIGVKFNDLISQDILNNIK